MVSIPRARVLRRSAAVALVILALGGPPASAAPPDRSVPDGTGSCTITSVGPVLYHTIVFPVIEARCDSVQRRISVSVVMTADGAFASEASRACRNTNVCYLDIDAWTHDLPGNQLWCATGVAALQKGSIGRASSCESNDF